ncbi:TPA: hypothetical protein ACH270_002843, partial [Klebsiella oxytoca]
RCSFSYSRQALVKQIGHWVYAARALTILNRRIAFGYGCCVNHGVAKASALTFPLYQTVTVHMPQGGIDHRRVKPGTAANILKAASRMQTDEVDNGLFA